MINDTILNSLNDVQKKAVVDTEGQLLVLAGAGSGKTRVLTTRVAHLVKNCGVDPYNILAITFTNKAAAEMKERINFMLGDCANVWISTFHSMCAKILFCECSRLGYNSNFSIYSEAESSRVVKRLLKADENEEATKDFDKYYNHIKRIKCYNLDADEYISTIENKADRRNVLNIYNDYQKTLKSSNAMDFDDLLLNTALLFKENPDVLEYYRKRFRYIHVDEFQDTNSIQYEIVRLLTGANGNLFVVGDEDQSIYGWRGAKIANILNFKKDYPNAKIYRLEENYRSTSYILNAANRVIANNKQRFGKKLYTSKDGGRRVEVFNAYNDREEVDYIVRCIKDIVDISGYNYGDIAILMRANSLSRQFEDALNLYGIHYRVFGGIKFYERREIKDLLAYLKIALNPKDVESAIRVINVPRRTIGETTVTKLLQYCTVNGMEFFDVVKNIESNGVFNAGTIKKIASFRDLWLDIIKAVNEYNATEFVEYVLKVTGLLDMYKADEAEPERFENAKEFVTAVSEFQKDNPNSNIDEFLRMVALISDIDDMDNGNVVTLATIHAVKGLEFPVVFIVALEENIFPSSRAINDSDDNIEEERRLMYVAITRAKERLYCSSARTRFRFNQYQNNKRSRFVDEMIGATPTINLSENRMDTATQQQRPLNNSFISKRVGKMKVNPTEFVAGKRVSHSRFGEGVIISTSGEGNEKIASISFEGLGIKKFVVAIANMEILD